MMDWIFGLVPWWVYVLAALAAVVAVWRLWGWPAALAAATAALAVLSYRRGRSDEALVNTAKVDKGRLDAIKNRKEIDDEVVKMDTPAIDKQLDPWMRD